MFKKFAIGALAALASLVSGAAWAADEDFNTPKSSPVSPASVYSFTIPIEAAVNDFSKAVPACPSMRVYFERGNSAVVSMYPADSDDDTSAEIEANTVINQFTTNEVYGPFEPTKQYVRFVVDTVNASVPSTVKVLCANIASGGGVLGSGPLADMLAASASAGDLWQQTDDDGTADCATGSGAGAALLCQYDGANWIPAGIAGGGGDFFANGSVPMTADLNINTSEIDSTMGSVGVSKSFPLYSITNPVTTTMGAGVTWGTDQTAKNRPSGSEIDTRNNLMGWFYNKTGVNGSIVSNCHPAWDWSHETNYRTTSATADDQWVELNFDLFPPEFTAVPTGTAGTPTVGEYMTLSGGGVVKVLAWSGGTLTVRQTDGACVANTQTYTGVTSGATGTIASLTSTQTSSDNYIRMFQFEWDTADDMTTNAQTEVLWTFDTFPLNDSRPATLRMRNGAVGVYMPDQLSRRFTVWNDGSYNSQANVLFEYDEAGRTGQSQNADILEIRHDYGTNANTNTYARGIHFLAPLNGGSVTVGRQHAIHIENMAGFGSTDSSIIMIESQTGTDGGDGNITHEGFNYNTGHFTAGAEGASGDHLWRDQTNEVWRTKTDSLPTSETDGNAFPIVVASGSGALGTSAISSEACATVVTATATGTATTDVVSWSFNGDVTAVTGYAPLTTGGVSIYAYPTANTVNFKVCNPTSGSITPGAVTLNWRVVR